MLCLLNLVLLQVLYQFTVQSHLGVHLESRMLFKALEESSGQDRLIHENQLPFSFQEIRGLILASLRCHGSTGLSEEMIRASMKERKHGALESVEQCCICQEDYVDGDDLGILDCKHEFHIEKWLLLKNRCPICNRKAMENVN
ncbi:E3 ubiquitin-protein ligase MBR2-like [Salvia splendens]|uniref:E3 ubiquitin-protein ligase MBR2-like n=1 Tax=Salvia splendens TaxID=180675 RepID=UPI001C270AF0|nr:E3 ubiquitin-protein ligase MBR2-like [Salvia splendens]